METHFSVFAAERIDALMALARLLTGNRSDAEDLVQDALLHAQRQWHKIEGADNSKAYMRRVLLNVYNTQQRRRRHPVIPLEDRNGGSPDERASFESLIGEREVVRRAIAELPVRQRTAVILRYYEDLDVSEIAGVMRISQSSVRSALSRAMESIRSKNPGFDKEKSHARSRENPG